MLELLPLLLWHALQQQETSIGLLIHYQLSLSSTTHSCINFYHPTFIAYHTLPCHATPRIADGIEATLRLRARENAQHLIESNKGKDGSLPWAGKLVIIGMSANSDAETRRLAHEAGMQYFLPKPFTIAEFRALLETIRNHEQ